MARLSGHLERLEEDHAAAAKLGIGVVRESIGWRIAERPDGSFDFDRVRRIADSARRHGLQVIWTFMHYGTPTDVSLTEDSFCARFVRFATAAARLLGDASPAAPVYNLINEIGFVAWAVTATRLMHPYRPSGEGPMSRQRTEQAGYAVKLRLADAVLRAIEAIREIDPRARFLHVEPVVHVVPPPGRPDLADLAETTSGHQWQAWDIIGGFSEPQLGGSPAALDLIGINHYHSGQWEVQTEQRLWWHLRDRRRCSFAELLRRVHARYRRPMIVAETSHVGDGRAAWLHEVAAQVTRARNAGVPVEGICLYPLIDRPDWEDPRKWHRSGLWDIDCAPGSQPVDARPLRRVLCRDYANALREWQPAVFPFDPPSGASMTSLVVFSHLRWDFVFQRPQHLMSRLRSHMRVLFIEEPVHEPGEPWLDVIDQGPDLQVLVAHTPIDAPGFDDRQMPVLRKLLSDFLATEKIIDDCVAWFYTPMALPLLSTLKPRAVVYDCMDELAAFKGAPPMLREREAALFAAADLVFTGGPALYEAKQPFHPNVVCLPSSVDAAHYAPATLEAGSREAAEAAALQATLGRPRLGFFGVIDERFDIELLREIAERKPDWQFVMVGPVVKIDPAQLPRRANIHWLGMRSYALLPHLCAGWDVCLLPFAINASTRFISPTKTLEYMAAERPIVSTPVRDVVGLYGDTVLVADGADAFVECCEQALAEHGAQRAARLEAMRDTVRRSSWEQAAQTVHRLIEAELRKADALHAPEPAAAPRSIDVADVP